jgi:hypothetical protein
VYRRLKCRTAIAAALAWAQTDAVAPAGVMIRERMPARARNQHFHKPYVPHPAPK